MEQSIDRDAQAATDTDLATTQRPHSNAMASSLSAACSTTSSSPSSPRPSTRTSPRPVRGPTTTRRRAAPDGSSATTSTGSGSTATAKLRCTGRCPSWRARCSARQPRFFHEHTLVKERDTHEVTPWHHDEPYYCVDGASNVSLWVSLDPVPRPAGVEFIVGSHLWGRRFVPRKFVDHDCVHRRRQRLRARARHRRGARPARDRLVRRSSRAM